MDPILLKYIVTGLVSLTVGLLLQRFQAKPNLKYFLPGTFLFDVTDPKVSIRTDSLTTQNFGSKIAQNIEIIHKERPDISNFHKLLALMKSLRLMEVTSPKFLVWALKNLLTFST